MPASLDFLDSTEPFLSNIFLQRNEDLSTATNWTKPQGQGVFLLKAVERTRPAPSTSPDLAHMYIFSCYMLQALPH
jgi:hypothetical protein